MDKSAPSDCNHKGGKRLNLRINPYGHRSQRGKIGLLGGSFNPAHDGHLHIAHLALRRLGLDAVWFMVSPQNPLKSQDNMASLSKRLTSVQRLIGQDCRLYATTIESDFKTNKTFDCLKKLRQTYPLINFVWIMGADNFIQLPKWFNWRGITKQMPMAIMARSPLTHIATNSPAGKTLSRWRIPASASHSLVNFTPPAWCFLPIALHPASSTDLRKKGEFL